MRVFEIHNNKIQVTEHALMVPVFKEIWDRDQSKEKTRAMRDLSYIEFMCNPRTSNPYYGRGERDKMKALAIDLYQNEDHEPDEDVIKAIRWYRRTLNEALPSLSMYLSVKNSVDVLSHYFRNAEVDDDTGAINTDANKLMANVLKSKELLANLDDLRQAVESEIFTVLSHKGNKKINPFERRPDSV